MEKQEEVQEQEHNQDKALKQPKTNSPPREGAVQQANPSSPPKLVSPTRQPKTNSPPREVQETNPSSPPKLYPSTRQPQDNFKAQSLKLDSPPPETRQLQHNSKPQSPQLDSPPPETRQPQHNSKPQSPPLDSAPPGEEEEDYKNPPFNDPSTTTTAATYTAAALTSKVGITSQEVNDEERVGVGNTGSGRRYLRPNLSILKRAKRDNMVKKALLAFRICGFVFSLVSFSVLAADRDRGWALDSFYRYKEFRYCMAVNVIAFVYSGFQGYDIAYQLTSGKRKVREPLRYYLDFSVDQMLTYLLISASSSAAVRVDDWQSNWGKDEFPDMARASVALSFLAFAALALSSLISGYIVCTLKSI